MTLPCKVLNLFTVALGSWLLASFRTPMTVRPDCPVPCVASAAGDTSWGTVPPYPCVASLIGGIPTNGTASEGCYTCSTCMRDSSLIFHSGGTGWCMQFNVNGSGWTNILKDFERVGVLSAICNQSPPAQAEMVIINCDHPSFVTYYKKVSLGCGCEL